MTLWQRTKMIFSGQQTETDDTNTDTGRTSPNDPVADLTKNDVLDNQSRAYKNLYRNSPLTQAIIDKIVGIIVGNGWNVLINPDVPTRVGDATLAWWETYRNDWKDRLKEGLITGIIAEEPLINRRNRADLLFNYLPSENIERVQLENGIVKSIDIDAVTNDYDITAGRWLQNVAPIEKRLTPSGIRYFGRVFYTRIDGLPSDKWGQSLLKSPLRTLKGYEEVVRNMATRSRIAQSLAWQVTQYDPQKPPSDLQRQNTALANLVDGQNQIIKMQGDEQLESVNPDIRSLDLPAYRIAMLEAVLAKFELPPDLFGHPDASNRATLDTAVRGFVQRYEALQNQLIGYLLFRLDYVASQIGGVMIDNVAEIDAPSVLVQSPKETVADQTAQENYLFTLYERGVLPFEVYVEQSRRIAQGEALDWEDIDLPPPEEPQPEEEPDANLRLRVQ